MREKIEDRKDIIELALKAMKEAGIEPNVLPIREELIVSRLSFMDFLHQTSLQVVMNYHGKYEYVSINSMEKQ